MNEFERIEKCLVPLTRGNVGALGLQDDCALLPYKIGHQLAVTKDAIVEHVHFLPDTSPELLAAKLLGVNLSDMAAMGARPLYYFIAAALPRSADDAWFKAFTDSLAQLQQQYDITLMGGDSVIHDGPLTLTLTMMGEVAEGKALYRNKAQVGDKIYVTGTIGDAMLGLKVGKGELDAVSDEHKAFLLNRYDVPQPRVDVGLALLNISQCATDISDGLLADMKNICDVSKVGANIYSDKLPLSDAAKHVVKSHPELRNSLVTGGDDYELIFTVSKDSYKQFLTHFSATSTPITCIGEVIAEEKLSFLDVHKNEITVNNQGYIHK